MTVVIITHATLVNEMDIAGGITINKERPVHKQRHGGAVTDYFCLCGSKCVKHENGAGITGINQYFRKVTNTCSQTRFILYNFHDANYYHRAVNLIVIKLGTGELNYIKKN